MYVFLTYGDNLVYIQCSGSLCLCVSSITEASEHYVRLKIANVLLVFLVVYVFLTYGDNLVFI